MRTVSIILSTSFVLLAQAPPPVQLTAQEDRQRLLDLLHIASLRNGANGSNPQAPNYANYDESKANPYPDLPDPLLMKNGKTLFTFDPPAPQTCVNAMFPHEGWQPCWYLSRHPDQRTDI